MSAIEPIPVAGDPGHPADETVPTPRVEAVAQLRSRGLWRDAFRETFRKTPARVGAVILSFLVVIAVFAPVIAPYDPNEVLLSTGVGVREEPCIHLFGCPDDQPQHLLGTDGNGRDFFSRIVYGARISLVAGLASVFFALIIGTAIGLVAGFYGRWVDNALMRVMDVLLAFPALLLAIVIVTVLGRGLFNAVIAISLVSIPVYARVVRSSVLSIREQDYVAADRALGASNRRIVWHRVLPNSLTPLVVQATLGVATAVLEIAALSFLGLGIQPPTAEWGSMLAAERNQVFTSAHLVVAPCIMIMLNVLAFNLIGDGFRDALDPAVEPVSAPEIEIEPTGTPQVAREQGPVLEVRDLRTWFFTADGVVKAVDGVDLTVHRGEVVGLVGESGSGKSVTMFSALRLVSPPGRVVGGEVRVGGQDVAAMGKKDLRRLRGDVVSMIFQQPNSSLNPCYRVGEQISEVYEIHERVKRKVGAEQAVKMLAEVGIPDPGRRAKAFPHQLSGGMAQRVMIAMALAADPELLIADEPTTALDVTIQAQILDLMSAMQQRTGMAMILITHDLGIVAEHTERVAVMYAGQIVEETDTTSLFRRPLHPYTSGLIGSVPVIGRRQEELAVIPGRVPNLIDLPPGCRFAPRCEARTAAGLTRCTQEMPALVEVSPGHKVRCFLHSDAAVTEVPVEIGKRGR